MRPVLDEPHRGSLTWAQYSESMTGVENAYRDALTGGREIGVQPKPDLNRWLRPALDESGKLEP